MSEAADQIRAAIAQNLKYGRRTAGLSLRELSARSGLSTALLSQLERGLANPTVEVLAGLAQTLGMSFADLSRVPLHDPQVLGPLEGDATTVAARTLFGSTDRRRFELYESMFPAKHRHESAPHGLASEEWAYVLTGSLELEVGGAVVELRSGEAVRFSAETEHAYAVGPEPTRLLTIVSMPTE